VKAMETRTILKTLGIEDINHGWCTGTEWGRTEDQGVIQSVSPIDGQVVGSVYLASARDYERIMQTAQEAFLQWRTVPGPKRGEIIRQIALKLREVKEPLGRLVTLEMGKSLQEGKGEVQEMIDIADFAVGLSRQLYGFTMQSERSRHRMYDHYHPLDESNHVGPLIDRRAAGKFTRALDRARAEGGEVVFGGQVMEGQGYESGCYVQPALVVAENRFEIVQEETFAPILYLIPYSGGVDNAIAIHNDVPQGLSSAIFTSSLRESEAFLSSWGSDCGIANVNIGTSGAEIGGAFGGEKETGGGRESGSDAWKAYMRRQTTTINYGHDLPLAQGIVFEV
jgi:acyl-CoA reductase-like NAD-dependent aldehyde dehydrogenase